MVMELITTVFKKEIDLLYDDLLMRLKLHSELQADSLYRRGLNWTDEILLGCHQTGVKLCAFLIDNPKST